MGIAGKERQGEFSVRPKRWVTLPASPWEEGSILFPRIDTDLENLLDDISRCPPTVACRRCSGNIHDLWALDLVWPYQGYNCYFGPVPGYKREGCPTVYLPSQIYRGLQRAVISEVRSRQRA